MVEGSPLEEQLMVDSADVQEHEQDVPPTLSTMFCDVVGVKVESDQYCLYAEKNLTADPGRPTTW